MKRIAGDLSLMSLQDLMQWAQEKTLSGTLKILQEKTEKKFYLQEGKLLFVTSNEQGERVAEFLGGTGLIPAQLIRDLITESRNLGIPFTGHLLNRKVIARDQLETAISQLATLALARSLKWQEGSFVFTTTLPPTILDGPIQVSIASALTRANLLIKAEQNRQKDPQAEIAREIDRKIAEDAFDIPPIPDIMLKIQQKMDDGEGSAHEIMKLIMADQILTTKILKVVNSAYYGLSNRVSSLQHAIVFVGFKAVLGIVTAHALGQMSVKNRDELQKILQHSLKCAYIGKKIAAQIGQDEEDAFVCGLLHDIGKTVMINLLADYDLNEPTYRQILEKYHPETGGRLALKWNLPPVVQEAILYHHDATKSKEFRESIEVIALANAIVNAPKHVEDLMTHYEGANKGKLDPEMLKRALDEVEDTVRIFA